MAGSAQSILDTIAQIEASLPKPANTAAATTKTMAGLPGKTKLPGPRSLQDIMRDAVGSPHMQELASHPDFPALAQDTGIQNLVSALVNQVGSVIPGNNSATRNTRTMGD